MLTFRCTQKVRDLLGLHDRDLSEETDGDLEEWFVEAATIEHRRCLLFTHKVTLYSFWVVGVRKPDLVAIEDTFRRQALATLRLDGFGDEEIGRLLPSEGHRFGKTNSRPVTGSMNDHVMNSRWIFAQEGGLKVASVPAINSHLNRTPMGALAPGSHMDFPIRVLTRILRPAGAA
jgi:hypothetical protein